MANGSHPGGGGGHPVALALAPGEHTLRAYFVMPDHRWMEQSFDAAVQAGHTHVVECLQVPGTNAVLLRLADRGKNEQCNYQRTDQVHGMQMLPCEPRAGP